MSSIVESTLDQALNLARRAALRDQITREHPDARLAERLEADRHERDLALRGSAKASDVHP